MDHHQIWWVGAGGEPVEQFNFGADRIPDAYPGSLLLVYGMGDVGHGQRAGLCPPRTQ